MQVLGMSETKAERGTRTKKKPVGGGKGIVSAFPRDFRFRAELDTWKKQMREGQDTAMPKAALFKELLHAPVSSTDTRKKRKRGLVF